LLSKFDSVFQGRVSDMFSILKFALGVNYANFSGASGESAE